MAVSSEAVDVVRWAIFNSVEMNIRGITTAPAELDVVTEPSV